MFSWQFLPNIDNTILPLAQSWAQFHLLSPTPTASSMLLSEIALNFYSQEIGGLPVLLWSISFIKKSWHFTTHRSTEEIGHSVILRLLRFGFMSYQPSQGACNCSHHCKRSCTIISYITCKQVPIKWFQMWRFLLGGLEKTLVICWQIKNVVAFCSCPKTTCVGTYRDSIDDSTEEARPWTEKLMEPGCSSRDWLWLTEANFPMGLGVLDGEDPAMLHLEPWWHEAVESLPAPGH